jgi:hypothetical protein
MTITKLLANPKLPNTGGWQNRHQSAVLNPTGFERPMVHLLTGWSEYAETHRARYESVIGDDGVLGPAWEEIGDALRTMLNGDLGRLDGGTLDSFILNTMRDNGVNMEHR